VPLTPLRLAFVSTFALALTASTLTFAAYVRDSTSASEQLRVLRNDTEKLRDTLRSQRNTPSPRSSSESTSNWLNRMQAAEEARTAARADAAEQRRLDEEWKRDHPNETRSAYYARIEGERDAARAANARAWDEYRRVQREGILQQIAERGRLDQLEWDRYRATSGSYTPRARPPLFTTTLQALTWCRVHDSQGFNNWASATAALLLMDGLGVPRDLPAAAAFADAQRPLAPGSDPVHPNLHALYLYLSTLHPELYALHRTPPDPANSRRELTLLSKTNALARWLLARVLAESSDPADQRQAILLLPDGYSSNYMLNHSFGASSEGYRLLEARLNNTVWKILGRGATSLPEILARWTPDEFADLLRFFRSPPAHDTSASGPNTASRVRALIEPYLLLNGLSDTPPTSPDPLYADASPSFDLAQASARFAAAYAPGTSRLDAQLSLLEATRLGDAFAPLALIRMLGERALKTDTRKKLRATASARRARDEAAGNPRALAARLIEARFEESEELQPLFTKALAAGSILAARARLSQRIDKSMARENDLPPSWNLPPALIAELDAAVVAANARPDTFHEWPLFRIFLNTEETNRVAYWFQGADLWEKDRQQRVADASLIEAIQPELDAVMLTLNNWPGLDPYNAQRAAQLAEAIAIGEKAEQLVATDGSGALALYLQAAGLGDRVALDRLAGHIKRGTGELPRSAELANRLTSTVLKMMQGDAEVGDSYAASFVGSALISGRFITQDRAAGLEWLRYAAGLGERDAASKLAGENSDRGDNNPAQARHWSAVGEGIEYGEMLLIPPRRLQESVIDLTSILPALDAAAAEAERRFAGPVVVMPSAADSEELGIRFENARAQLQTDSAKAFIEMAQTAAAGYRFAPFTLAQLLTGGRFGLHPALARRFHAVGLAHLKSEADHGDIHSAHRLGLHYLDLLEKPDPAAALGWFAYAASIGYDTSASTLADIYAHGAPGIAPDPAAARRWRAIALEINTGQNLPVPARITTTPKVPLAALRAPLQLALAAAHRASVQAQPVPEGDSSAREEAARVLLETDPPAAILVLAQLAAEGRSASAFELAAILSSGSAYPALTEFEPEPELARQFQAAGRALLVAEGEHGDAEVAYQLGRRLLNPVEDKPDPAAALRWLTYAAERGSFNACEYLARLYAANPDGIPPDAAAAARWSAFGETISRENFKPRTPLR